MVAVSEPHPHLGCLPLNQRDSHFLCGSLQSPAALMARATSSPGQVKELLMSLTGSLSTVEPR